MNPSMNPNQALWEVGDFTRIAQSMRDSGAALAKSFGITRGMRVLDLGCGDGTTAVPAAELGAEVLGVDIARNLVEAGNRRAAAAGLANCRFQHGDATELRGLDGRSFDLVVSIFGAMFAPRPMEVAKEMVRVARPGGRIIMGNWIPHDPTLVAQILKICSSFTTPPPAGFISPMTWGSEAEVLARFAGAGIPVERVAMTRETFTFRAACTPDGFLDLFRSFYGPTMRAYETAERDGRAATMHGELLDLFVRENRSLIPNETVIPATFLRVTVTI
ncbi:hypothetical protein LBMAG53_24940 [Planctomycetota bacterium]|nr:hypothetical protein LBMAG53_24940 [Planctomycetota bacterium]